MTASWSSRLAFYLGTVGAAVGLGSIWRFPFLAGTSGGFAFIFVFLIACLAIATPLLVAEFLIGRWSRRSPPQAAGDVAASVGASRAWNAIGWLGAIACYLVFTYYPMIAGWVLAYTWKFASGAFAGMDAPEVGAHFRSFLADPVRIAAWHLGFLVFAGGISALGLNRGIETANRIRAPALLSILLLLAAYSLATGDVARGLAFAFAPDFSKLTAEVVLAAIGQSFYATGVGIAMMMAYGSYVSRDVSLWRAALVISGSVIVVSLLATLMIFPLVFAYGMNPAQGPELVFDVLPRAFAAMPAGRLIGTLFFVLLVFAALTPTIASMEPVAAWLEQRFGLSRPAAVAVVAASGWVCGLASVLSFNLWAGWRPLASIALFSQMTPFALIDFTASNILMPIGALLASVFVGWRIAAHIPPEELEAMAPPVRRLVLLLLRYLCPVAIAAVLLAAFI